MSEKGQYVFNQELLRKQLEKIKSSQPISGEMALVTIPVQVVFEYSDKIVVDVDDNGNPVEYKSGFLMHVLSETLVYNGEPRVTLAMTQKETPTSQ